MTEYQIGSDDTLNGLLVAEVAYGYGVMPIFYTSSEGNQTLMPSDDIRLAVGDCSEDAAFEGANAIARISRCSLTRVC